MGALTLEVQRMVGTVQRLERAVQGDPDADIPSVRHALKAGFDELKAETERVVKRVDDIEDERARDKAHMAGMMTVIKWLGGSSLAALVGLIALLVKSFGGGA